MTVTAANGSSISRQRLRELHVRSDRRGLAHLAGHLLILAATGALVFASAGGP